MRKWWSIVFVLTTGCQTSNNLQGGEWKLVDKEPSIFPLYHFYERLLSLNNTLKFKSDTFRIKSGIFYDIYDVQDEKVTKDKYPFVFYGKESRYLFDGDSLKLHYPPYDRWVSFKVKFRDKNDVVLYGLEDEVFNLKRVESPRKADKEQNEIEYVYAEVFDVSSFFIEYSTKIFPNDSAAFVENYLDTDSSKVTVR